MSIAAASSSASPPGGIASPEIASRSASTAHADAAR